MVSVTVVEPSGVPIANLQPQDFRIRADGEEVDVAVVLASSSSPLDVALVVDLSSSMDFRTWRRDALAFMRALLPDRDCVFQLSFGSRVGSSVWGRPDDPALIASIEESEAIGGTALYDALVTATAELDPGRPTIEATVAFPDLEEQAGPRQGATAMAHRPVIAPDGPGCPAPIDVAAWSDLTKARRRVVVVVTDGDDTTSSQNVGDVLLASHVAGVPIFHVMPSGAAPRSDAPPSFSPSILVHRRRKEEFDGLVFMTGGTRVPASAGAFEALGQMLRGYYRVGYYVSGGETATPFEFTRHEVHVELRGTRNASVYYQPVVYYPTTDPALALAEIQEATRLLQDGDIGTALVALDGAIEADPYAAAAFAYRALALQRLDRLADAYVSALRATELAPGNPDAHRLATRLAAEVGDLDLAWEQAICAAQAGADMRAEFESLARRSSAPERLAERLEAPTVVVRARPAEEPDLLARAALPKAMRAVGVGLAAAPELGLVTDTTAADYTVWISERSLSTRPPRKFRGDMELTAPDGVRLYRKGFTLDDVDDPAASGADLADYLREIDEKIHAHQRRGH